MAGVIVPHYPVQTQDIADEAVTDEKIKAPVSPEKIGEGTLNLGSGTIIAREGQFGG